MASGMPRRVRALSPVAVPALLVALLGACATPGPAGSGSTAPAGATPLVRSTAGGSPIQHAGPVASAPAIAAATPDRASSPRKPRATADRRADPAAGAQPTGRPTRSRLSDDDGWQMVKVPQMDPYNDAVIENSSASTRVIRVCRDWGTTRCRAGTPVRTLRPGQNSRTTYRWDDTDGYDLGHGWVKQHGCFRCTVTLIVR